jgi:hypothetical protein
MKKVHESLKRDHAWYAKYHTMRHVTLINFVLLVIVGVWVTQLLTERIDHEMQLAAVAIPTVTAPDRVDPAAFAPGHVLVHFRSGVNKAQHDAVLAAQGAKIEKTIPRVDIEVLKVPVGAEKKVPGCFRRIRWVYESFVYSE